MSILPSVSIRQSPPQPEAVPLRPPHSKWQTEATCSPDDTGIILKLLAAMTKEGYSRHDLIAMRVTVGEALINAHKHGNKRDPTKTIRVSFEVTSGCAIVRVTDQGAGFDPESVPDPTAPENMQKPNGRGLLMMRRFMSWVRYNKRGNQVTLCLVRSNRTLDA